MHFFSGWPPLPEEAIIATFRAILAQAAQPDRLEYWTVAASVYRALAMESRAQTRQGILLRASEKEHTRAWLDTTIVEALQVVNGPGRCGGSLVAGQERVRGDSLVLETTGRRKLLAHAAGA